MSDFPPGSDEAEEQPIDDAVDFDVRIRQAAIRRCREGRRLMAIERDKMTASLQSFRDGLHWVDERTRKPLP
jgi:hypothetical protein